MLLCLAENGMPASLGVSELCYELAHRAIHTRCPPLTSEGILNCKLLISVSCTKRAEKDAASLRSVCWDVLGELSEQRQDLRWAVMQPVLTNSAVSGLLCAIAAAQRTAQRTEGCKIVHERAESPDAEIILLISSENIEVRRAAWRGLLAMLASGEHKYRNKYWDFYLSGCICRLLIP